MVCQLLEHAPPQLHLVIATRVDPPLPLTRLGARGHLTEVRAAQLQFAVPEASVFLNTVMGVALPTQQIATLQSRTEGWIAGLQLAALSLQGCSDAQQFLADFSGSHRHIVDYLVELERLLPNMLHTQAHLSLAYAVCLSLTQVNLA